MKYPSKFIDYIYIVNELLSNKKFNLHNFRKITTNFAIITKLAVKEIYNDKTIINKKLAICNYGLDSYDIFLKKLINYATLYIEIDEIKEIVNNIDNIDKIDYFSKRITPF
jgi:hypothetical protein